MWASSHKSQEILNYCLRNAFFVSDRPQVYYKLYQKILKLGLFITIKSKECARYT